MGSNERARQNYDALFPNNVSTLATTDPELIDVFDSFAFDEVLQGSTLDVRTRLRGYPRTLNALRAIDQIIPA